MAGLAIPPAALGPQALFLPHTHSNPQPFLSLSATARVGLGFALFIDLTATASAKSCFSTEFVWTQLLDVLSQVI